MNETENEMVSEDAIETENEVESERRLRPEMK